MSEKFNPLAEADSNASHDRRRFYDWTGDNADHQTNEEFRAANEDMANFLRSRDFEDDNGSLHDAESSKFMKNPNSETDDEYYSRMQPEGEAEGPFSGKSLKEIAEMVGEAKQSNDKTFELDARAAFDDAFMEMAEKYEWQGVVKNADGTTTDRNVIADSKLAYFESLMGKDSEAKQTTDDEKEAEEEFVFGRKVSVQRTSGDIEDDWTVRSASGDTVEVVKDDPESGDVFVKSVPRDELMKLNNEEEDSDSSETQEGESLAEYEARQLGGDNTETGADDLEIIGDTKPSPSADDLEMIEDDEEDQDQPKNRRTLRDRARRVRNMATPAGLAAEMSARAYTRNERGPRSRFNKITRGLGGAALLIGGGILLMKGHNVFDGGGNGADVANNLPDIPKGSGGPAIDTIPFDTSTGGNGPNVDPTETLKFADGSGGEQLMKTLGTDPSHYYQDQEEFMKEFPKYTYRMNDGNVGLLDQNTQTSASAIPQRMQEWWAKRS